MKTDIIEKAKQKAIEGNLPYAGDVTPQQAWQLHSTGQAKIVDVRTPEEYDLIGHVPGSVLVPWQIGNPRQQNPEFLSEIKQLFRPDDKLLLLCRGAFRSVKAATALKQAGFTCAMNVLEGFEGKTNLDGLRGRINGWLFHQLPWER